ncbi:MAG: glycosyltransferase family 4 protein [Thermoleophilaceae bacterium]
MRVEGDIQVHALIDSLTVGGAEMLLAEFAPVARSAGIELSVGYLSGDEGSPAAGRLRESGVEPGYVPLGSLKDPSALRRVRRHLVGVGPDLVHTHLEYADLIGGVAARSLRIPAVSTLHAAEWPTRGRAGARSRLAAMVRRRYAHRVIAVSENARSSYLARGWDVPEHVVTIHNGIAGRAEPGTGARVRAQLGLGPDDLVVAVVAALRPEKGHEIAAAACGRLVERFPKLRLLVVGDGEDRESVERALAPLGPRAIRTGYRDDVMAVLDASDVLLAPSYTDAFPTALIEAMAAGVPVVASAVGGIPEIVDDGATGLLVAPPPRPDGIAEALARALERPELRCALGRAARERFERRFSAVRWAQETRGIYETVLEGTRAGGRHPRARLS